jgi:hypothetical protein
VKLPASVAFQVARPRHRPAPGSPVPIRFSCLILWLISSLFLIWSPARFHPFVISVVASLWFPPCRCCLAKFLIIAGFHLPPGIRFELMISPSCASQFAAPVCLDSRFLAADRALSLVFSSTTSLILSQFSSAGLDYDFLPSCPDCRSVTPLILIFPCCQVIVVVV